MITLPMNKENFITFFLVYMPFICFTCIYFLVKIFHRKLREVVTADTLNLSSDIWGKTLSFLSLGMLSAALFLDALYQIEQVPFNS